MTPLRRKMIEELQIRQISHRAQADTCCAAFLLSISYRVFQTSV